MPAMTDLLVKDDTVTTPLEFTFQPVSDTPMPLWRTAQTNVPVEGQMRLAFDVADWKSGGYKTTMKLEVPVMETLGASGTSAGYIAPPKVAYVNTLIVTSFSDRRSTLQDRANLLKIGVGLLQGASATTATGILAQTAAGNAFVNSVLAIPFAFIRLLKPN